MLATKILFARLGQNGAKLFFSVAIGDSDSNFSVTIRDCVLRDGSKGPFVSYPSKPRTRRAEGVVDGVKQSVYVQEIKDSKPVYDNIVDLYFDKVEGKEERKATQASWDLKEQIAAQAEQMYAKLSGSASGRGVAAGAAAPTGVATKTAKTAAASVFDDDEDLPF